MRSLGNGVDHDPALVGVATDNPNKGATSCARLPRAPSTKRERRRPGWLGARSGTREALLFASARRRCSVDALEKRSNAGGRIAEFED